MCVYNFLEVCVYHCVLRMCLCVCVKVYCRQILCFRTLWKERERDGYGEGKEEGNILALIVMEDRNEIYPKPSFACRLSTVCLLPPEISMKN